MTIGYSKTTIHTFDFYLKKDKPEYLLVYASNNILITSVEHSSARYNINVYKDIHYRYDKTPDEKIHSEDWFLVYHITRDIIDKGQRIFSNTSIDKEFKMEVGYGYLIELCSDRDFSYMQLQLRERR